MTGAVGLYSFGVSCIPESGDNLAIAAGYAGRGLSLHAGAIIVTVPELPRYMRAPASI